MGEEPRYSSHVSAPSSSSSSFTATPHDSPPCSSSSPSTSQLQAEEANQEHANEDIQHTRQHQHQQQLPNISYWVSISMANPSVLAMKNDVWSCLLVLITFWLVASAALVVAFYGSLHLQMGPYCSRLIEINSMLVQSVKVEQLDEPKPGLMLYGFEEPPPLDVNVNWTETYNASLPAKLQKEWIFYLNKDSQLDVFYSVKSPGAPLSLVIAKGREGLVEWIKHPSLSNATLYWNIIFGSGRITQKISYSCTYYVAVGNMNPENVEVEFNFTVNALLYNTTSMYNRCSLDKGLCRLRLLFTDSNTAVLTTPGPTEGVFDEEWFNVKVYYEPRWIIYCIGSGMMAVIILLVLRFCQMVQTDSEERARFQQVEVVSERAPLLPNNKDAGPSSCGSSYESFSSEEEDLTMWIAANSAEGKPIMEGETNNDLKRLCVICFDAPRDCFFLPCGHCAACFACGTRIAAEASTCPICRRKLKKVRKIFTV